MKKISIALLFALYMVTLGEAQEIQLTPTVQPTQARQTQVGNFGLSYTIGEPLQTTLQNGNLMFTQGFEQPRSPQNAYHYIYIVKENPLYPGEYSQKVSYSDNDERDLNDNVSCFPNTEGSFYPLYSCEKSSLKVSLFDPLVNAHLSDVLPYIESGHVVKDIVLRYYNSSGTILYDRLFDASDMNNYPFAIDMPTSNGYGSSGSFYIRLFYTYLNGSGVIQTSTKPQSCFCPLIITAYPAPDFTVNPFCFNATGTEVCFTTSYLNGGFPNQNVLSALFWTIESMDEVNISESSPNCPGDCSNQTCANIYEGYSGDATVSLFSTPPGDWQNIAGDLDVECYKRMVIYIPDAPLVPSITPDLASVCVNNEATVEITATGGISPYSYEWQTVTGITPGTNTATIDGSTISSGMYSATVTDANQCTATAIYTIDVNCCDGDIITGGTTTYTIPDEGVPTYVSDIDPAWFLNNSNTIGVNGTLIVDDNLTITNCPDITMGKNAKIIVQAGKKLIIDNSTLHTCSDYMWQGILVEGVSSKSQTPISGSGSTGTYWQGAVFMNNSTIDDAEKAIDISPTVISKRGGFIQATGSSFTNNRTDVILAAYRNFSASGNTINNRSFFTDCHFTTTNMLSSADPNPYTHVILYEVSGIKFKGCVFENTRVGFENDYELGNGLLALDANFAVDNLCTAYSGSTCTAYTPSQFINLRHGVYMGTFISPKLNFIRNSKFDHCIRAIRNEGVNFTRFTGNDIAVGNTAAITDITNLNYALLHEGIILRHCTGFTVEGNDIHPALDANDEPETPLTIGIRADGTGGQSNTIRNNTFTELFSANVANRQNRTITLPLTGLQYLCNPQTDNGYDICVTQATTGDPNGASTGVRQNQGSQQKAAGNKFTDISFAELQNEGNFYNHSPNFNNYFWHFTGTDEEPLEISTSVLLSSTNNSGGCPSSSNNGTNNFNHHLSGKNQTELKNQYSAYRALLSTESLFYSSKIDNGNTQRMLSFLDTMDYNYYAVEVSDTLMSASPYLSQKALLKAAVMRYAVSDSIMFRLLLANPDGVVSEALIEKVNEREMPDGWFDSVLLKKAIPTERTYLEDSIQKHASLKSEAAYEIISRLTEEEDSTNYTMLRQWLDSLQNPMADAYKAMTYIETATPDTALTKLRAIHGQYNLSAEDSSHLNSIDTLLTYYRNWFNAQTDTSLISGDVTSFDTTTTNLFDSLASQKNEYMTGTQAVRNIMNTMFGRNYFTPAQLPEVVFAKRDELEGETRTPTKEVREAKLRAIKVYPNPAKDYITFESTGVDATATLQVYNAYGQKIMETVMTQPAITIDTKQWGSGIYFWRVIDADKKKEQGKISVMRW